MLNFRNSMSSLSCATLALSLTVASAQADVILIDSGLYLHLDAADPAGTGGNPGDGNTFTTWANLASTGSSLDAVYQSGVNRAAPTWRASTGPNGTAAVEFDAPNSANGTPLKSGTAADWTFLHDGSPHTIFIVTRTTAANPDKFMPVLDSGSAATGLNVGMSISYEDRSSLSNNDSLTFTISSGVSPFFVERIDRGIGNIANNVFPAATWGMISTNYQNGRTGNDMVELVNGSQVAFSELAVPPNTGNNSANGLFLGSTFQISAHLEGSIAEILIYDRLLSIKETKQVGAYLEEKYALGITNIPEPTGLAVMLCGGISLLHRRRPGPVA